MKYNISTLLVKLFEFISYLYRTKQKSTQTFEKYIFKFIKLLSFTQQSFKGFLCCKIFLFFFRFSNLNVYSQIRIQA